MKCQAGWSTSWNHDCQRNINNLRYADDTSLIAESEEELKSLLMKVKEEREKVGLKLSIQKMKIMASGPIESESESESHSVMSNSLQPHARLLCPWDSPGKNTGVDHHTLLPEDLPDPRIEPVSLTSLLDWQAGSLLLVPPGKPITSWQVDGETMEAVIDFIILGSKITEDGNCSNKIKRCLLLGRKLWPT